MKLVMGGFMAMIFFIEWAHCMLFVMTNLMAATLDRSGSLSEACDGKLWQQLWSEVCDEALHGSEFATNTVIAGFLR